MLSSSRASVKTCKSQVSVWNTSGFLLSVKLLFYLCISNLPCRLHNILLEKLNHLNALMKGWRLLMVLSHPTLTSVNIPFLFKKGNLNRNCSWTPKMKQMTGHCEELLAYFDVYHNHSVEQASQHEASVLTILILSTTRVQACNPPSHTTELIADEPLNIQSATAEPRTIVVKRKEVRKEYWRLLHRLCEQQQHL